MDILERRETWLHTYFVTDCVRLSVAQGRDIEAAILAVLRQHHIVYGIRFAESRHDPGIRIILERIPLRRVLDSIEEALRRIVAPIPAKPATVRLGVVEPDAVTSPARSSSTLPSTHET